MSRGVQRDAFHLGEGERAADDRRPAVGLEEGRRLLHARLETDPLGLAAVADGGEGGVPGILGAGLDDVVGLQGVGKVPDLVAGGVAELDPAQVEHAAAVERDARLLRDPGDVERAGREVLRAVGHEHEQAAVGGVVAHDHGAPVGHDLHQLVGDAPHAVVLDERAGAVGMDRHLGDVAVVIGIGGSLVAEQVLAERLELGDGLQRALVGLVAGAGDGGRIGLVFLAGQVRVPGRQAGAAGDPEAVGAWRNRRCGT